ncbi:hypothetical protein C8J57DRAFT_637980 [Mycena rebaudengoi]|nr:hypothetical protein C8J57DRAFT_637980 [Mycena rebaudengoi]
MPTNIGETSLVFTSLADSVFPDRTAALVGASALVIGCMIHRIWPRRLTYNLVASMQETEKLYYDAIEAGELPRDVATEEKLLSLQKKMAETHEATLRNSSSIWKALEDFFRGRSITLLQCADDIQSFKNHVEILKVTQLRTNLNSTNPGLAASVRRAIQWFSFCLNPLHNVLLARYRNALPVFGPSFPTPSGFQFATISITR